MSGLAEGFGFSAIRLASGHRKWVPAHSIRDWLHCIRGLSLVMHGSSYCSIVFDLLLRLLEEELWQALTPLHGQNLMASTTRHIFDGSGQSGSLMRTFKRHCLCLP